MSCKSEPACRAASHPAGMLVESGSDVRAYTALHNFSWASPPLLAHHCAVASARGKIYVGCQHVGVHWGDAARPNEALSRAWAWRRSVANRDMRRFLWEALDWIESKNPFAKKGGPI